MRTRLWYADLPLTIPKRGPRPPRPTISNKTSKGWNGGTVHAWQLGQITDWTSTPQGTSDVRLDPQLNKKVWEQGVKGVPYRIRVRISRRRNDEDGAKEKLYSYVQAVNVKNPKGLVTTTVEEEEQ